MLLQVTKYGNERRFNIKDIIITQLSRLFEVEVLELVTSDAQKYQDEGWVSLLLHWLYPHGHKMTIIPEVSYSQTISPRT